ncbi:O-antigen ligase family protein [Paracoccus lutimaris]|uniref:O-antigen ligase n=1 Tax=Paracoccus lutimaris TaxID=1490030 RepID=A0A368YJ64_9RHOB|nr:O-antigen ligase family protein [Paracoccus lutimaris]RCW79649.1 O-antigen ligase [Paracoccus lutimaris]
MVDLGASPHGPAAHDLPKWRAHQQKAFWLGIDLMLGLLVLAGAGDLPNRWGVAKFVWLLAYLLTALRIMAVWPAYFRLLGRNWPYLLYPAVCAMSVVWSVSRPVTAVGGAQLIMTALMASYLGWRFAPRKLVLILFATTLGGATASALNLATGVFQPVFSDVGGLLGIYTNKNMLGHYSLVAMLIALSLILSTPGEMPRLARAIAVPALVLCAAMVILSKSMTAVVLMPCYCGLILLLNRDRLPAAMRHFTLMAMVALIALAPMILTIAGIDPMAALFAATGKDATLTGRTDLWSIGAHMIGQSPISGYGFGAFWVNERFAPQHFEVLRAGSSAPSFHNFLADVGIGTGLIGIAAILILVLTTLRRAFRRWRASGSAMSVCWLVLSILPINVALGEPFLYRQHEFMLSWVIMLGVSLGEWRSPSRIPGGTA